MNDRGIFQLTKADLLKEIVRSFSDAILLGRVTEIPVFPEYESETESLADLKEQLCQILSNKNLDIIVNILGVMNRNGVSGYSFVHHHFWIRKTAGIFRMPPFQNKQCFASYWIYTDTPQLTRNI